MFGLNLPHLWGSEQVGRWHTSFPTEDRLRDLFEVASGQHLAVHYPPMFSIVPEVGVLGGGDISPYTHHLSLYWPSSHSDLLNFL